MALVPLARDFWGGAGRGGAGKGVWKERRKQPGHCEQNYGTIKLPFVVGRQKRVERG